MSDLIETMARAMGRALAKAIENDVYACEMTLTERKIIADAAYQALRETLVPVGWECFRDPSYYDMWCVRPVGSRAFGEGFHLVNGDEAKALTELLGTLFALPEIDNE